MSIFTGAYPIADYGPNSMELVGYPDLGAAHYHGVRGEAAIGKGDISPTMAIPGMTEVGVLVSVQADASGEVEKFRFIDKPEDLGTITAVTVRVVQKAVGFTAAGGFVEFPITLYKGDGTTVLGTTTAHIDNDFDPWDAINEVVTISEYTFSGLTVSEADVGAGLVVKLDSTDAGAGWGTGSPVWLLIAVDGVITYTSDTVFESIVTVTTPLSETMQLSTPITDCELATPLDDTAELSTPITA